MITHRPPHIHPEGTILFLTGRCYGGFSWLTADSTKQYLFDKLQEILPRYAISLDAYVICNNHYHLLIRPAKGALVTKFVGHLHGATSHFIKQNMPDIVTVGEQVLTSAITPWDKRQSMRLQAEAQKLERELKFANPRGLKSATTDSTDKQRQEVVAQFIARHPIITRGLKSATTDTNVVATFTSRITDPTILALFLAKDRPIWYQYMDHVIRNETDYYMHANYIHHNPVKHGLNPRMSLYRWSSMSNWITKYGKEYVLDCFRKYPVVDFSPQTGEE